jgi:hypothetical protein
LGQYRGFDTELSFDSFGKEYIASLKGTLTYSVSLGTDIFGNITRLDNVLDGLQGKSISCKEQLEAVIAQLENAMTEVERPFPQEAELSEKSARLNEINIALNLDKRDIELVDAVPDEGEEQPQKKERNHDYER